MRAIGECQLWTGPRNSRGYGLRSLGTLDGKRVLVLAHRYAWERANGPIPEHASTHGLCVCHACDVRLCVNPAHLFLGTHEDNMRDMHRKGRSGSEKVALADIERALEALAAGASVEDIAASIGLSASHLCKVLSGEKRVLVADSLRERARAGCRRRPRARGGNATNTAKLTEDDVRELRRRYVRGVVGYERLAKAFGVAPATVRDVVIGRSWTHLP